MQDVLSDVERYRRKMEQCRCDWDIDWEGHPVRTWNAKCLVHQETEEEEE